jgi:hypothetical protein
MADYEEEIPDEEKVRGKKEMKTDLRTRNASYSNSVKRCEVSSSLWLMLCALEENELNVAE